MNRNLCLLLVSLALPPNLLPADVLPLGVFPHPPSLSASGDSYGVVMTPDGRFVVFCSTADNLVTSSKGSPVPAQIPPRLQVYLRDRQAGLTHLVSVSTNGAAANEDALGLQVSLDGRYVLFQSAADNLTGSDTNKVSDVFLRDVVEGTTLLVSGTTWGVPGNGDSHSAVMTPNAAVVAFVSSATNLVAQDNNSISDAFVWYRETNTTVLASVGATATNVTNPAGYSDVLSITEDGRYLAFVSTAFNLVPQVRLVPGVYIRDLQEGVTRWASREAAKLVNSVHNVSNAFNFHPVVAGEQPLVAFAASALGSNVAVVAQYSLSTDSAVIAGSNAVVPWPSHREMRCLTTTPNGRFVAYTAQASNDANTSSIQLWDAQTQTTTLVSGNAEGSVETGTWSDQAALTPDGRFVVFATSARSTNVDAFAPGAHVYVRDLLDQATDPIDLATNGLAAGVVSLAPPRISGDGRYVLFTSAADNLVSGDANAAPDVFIRDRWYNTNELVSVRHSALPVVRPPGPERITEESLSADGRYVVLTTIAGDPNTDTNGCEDVYLLDRTTGNRTLVSANTNGLAGSGASWGALITPDGRWVAFSSHADDLVSGDTNTAADVFLRDLHTGKTERVSVGMFDPATGPSFQAQLAPDASWVLFTSRAASSNAPAELREYRIYIRHRGSGETRTLSTDAWEAPSLASFSADGRFLFFPVNCCRVQLYDTQLQDFVFEASYVPRFRPSISPDGTGLLTSSSSINPALVHIDRRMGQTNHLGEVMSSWSRFSSSGRYIVLSTRTQIVPEDLYPGGDVYLYDLVSKEWILISAGANGESSQPVISSDERFVAFRSAASNLVPGDNNGQPDVFVWDRQTRSTWVVSATASGTANNRSMLPMFTSDGQWLVFSSYASDLAEADSHQSLEVFGVPLYVLKAVHSDEGGLSLEWPSVPGRTYTVEYADSLDGSWQPLNEAPTNLGHKMKVTPSMGAGSHRFYRLKVGGL